MSFYSKGLPSNSKGFPYTVRDFLLCRSCLPMYASACATLRQPYNDTSKVHLLRSPGAVEHGSGTRMPCVCENVHGRGLPVCVYESNPCGYYIHVYTYMHTDDTCVRVYMFVYTCLCVYVSMSLCVYVSVVYLRPCSNV